MKTSDNLDIILDPPDVPNAVHTNGDKIKGQVRLFNGHKVDLDQISIHLKGKAKSRVVTGSGDNRRVHFAKGILFNLKKDLTPPTVSTTPSFLSHEWSFEFEIPWESQCAEQHVTFAPHENFEHQPGFPLPPTMDSLTDNANQKIYYYLEVIANDRRAMFFRTKKARLHIKFAPSRPTLTTVSPCPYFKTTNLFRCTKALDTALIEREKQLTIAQKMRNVFSEHEQKPIAHFTIESMIPCQGAVGGSFPLSLNIRHDSARSTAPQTPVIILTKINARFTSHTYGRVPYRGFLNSDSACAYHVARRNKLYFCDKSISVPMFEDMELGELLTDMLIPDGLTPSFTTYNITRRYDLKVTADLVCVGQKYQISLGNEYRPSAFNMLPKLCKSRFDDFAERREVGEEASPAAEERRIQEGLQATERSLPVNDEDVEWLPPYEEVVSPGPPYQP